MKDETKSKLKKYGKRAGFGLGLVAFFLLGVGVGACSARKAVGSSAEGISQPAPRYALDPNQNLLNVAERIDNVTIWRASASENGAGVSRDYEGRTYVIPMAYMPEGAMFAFEYEGGSLSNNNFTYSFLGSANGVVERARSGNFGYFSGTLCRTLSLVTNNAISPFVFTVPVGTYGYVIEGQGSSNIQNITISVYDSVTGIYLVDSAYYLNNADGVNVEFSDNWMPYGLFTNRSSGNLGIVTNNFGNAQTTQNTLIRASFSDLLFTCGDGFGYDSIRVTARPLWNGAKFINENGEVVTYSFSEQNEFIPLVINYIDYRRFDTQAWVRVADYSLFISSDGSTIAINPRLSWVSPLYMTPRFFRYPAGFVYPNWEISSDVGSTWAYWNRVNPPSGLTFFDWFSFSPEDVHISELDGFGGVFTLISSGFTSVMPLLNVQILPFLTLGMLLFAPVVVVLIVAIIKLLAK